MAQQFLWRMENTRMLPVPNTALYTDEGDPMPFWQGLLAFGDTRGLPVWRSASGWTGRPCANIRHLIHLHQLAFTAESTGAYKRADYFWNELYVCLRRVWKELPDWDAAARLIGTSVVSNGETLRRVIAVELMLDSHMAFANGDTRDFAGPGARALAHLSWIRALLDLTTPPLASPETVLLPLIESRTAQLEKAGEYTEAIAWLKSQPKFLSETLASSIARLIFDSTVAKLQPDGERSALKNAELLASGIIELRWILLKTPDIPKIYEHLSELHLLRCVQLVKGNDAAEALAACAKAIAHNPHNATAKRAMVELTKYMQSIQKKCKRLQDALHRKADFELNEAGEALRQQAKVGFSTLERFKTSSEPELLAKARTLAIAANVWRSVQKYPNAARPANEQLLQFWQVASALFEIGNKDELALLELLESLAAKQRDLPSFDANALARFVARRRYALDEACDKSEATMTTTPEARTQHAIPLPLHANQDRQPLLNWLMGKQDVGTRILAASALACVTAVAVLSVVEMSKRATRDQAVLQIRQSGPDNAEAVITASERFLLNGGVGTEDPRRSEVVDAYAQALSNWFLSVEKPAEEPVRARVDTYRRLAVQ